MATDTTATRPAEAPPGPRPSGLPRDGASHVRGDIEGLRAVAVLLVIADHLFGWPHGGFIGVDVFFVISGFLITGLLLREHQSTGRISFPDFYRRRIRRILPASVLVLVVTAVMANVVFFANRAQETVDDALWALLFAGNWHFAIDGTDYQQAGDAVSPLQHYWSLSVEEQFYVVWPVVLLVVLGLAGRRRGQHGRRGLGAMAVVTVLVVAAGFAWAMHETTSAPTWAYFSTFSRSWELGLGALLAVLAPAMVRLPAWLRPVLGWAGLAGIAVGAVLIDSTTPFPAPWALVPVLSTVVVIAAGTGGDSRLLPVDNPVGRYVGALSYSLYLWHFPVIVLLAELMPADGRYYALVGAITLVAATASYHLVEQPIRRSSWLRPGARRPRRRVAVFGGWVVTALAAALVAVFVVLPAAGSSWPWAQPTAAAAPPPAAPPLVQVDPGAEAAAIAAEAQVLLANDIAASLTAAEWPELSPNLDSPGEEVYAPEWVVDECLNITNDADVARCTYGDPAAEKTAVLLGDSVAISWMPGIRRALEGSGWRIQVLTLGQCPQVPVPVRAYRGGDNFEEICPAHQTWALEQVQRIQPDLVIMSSAANSLVRLLSDNTGEAALAEWRQGLQTLMTSLQALPARMVVLGTPPPGENIQECLTRYNGPQDCVSPISEETNDFIRVEQETVAQFRGTALQVSYLDTRSWFCDAAQRCPLSVGTVPVFADGTHMVAPYAARLAPLLAPALLG